MPMRSVVKQFLSDCMLWICQRKYNNSYEKRICTYDSWIRKKEAAFSEIQAADKTIPLIFIPFSAADSYCKTVEKAFLKKARAGKDRDITIFLSDQGRPADWAEELIARYFAENRKLVLLYADEDVISPEGIRYTPWFKPDWSPDTFLSQFYFGSIFAVRTSELEGFSWRDEESAEQNLYLLCSHILHHNGAFDKRKGDMIEQNPVMHLDEVLFHSFTNREMGIAQSVRNKTKAELKMITGQEQKRQKKVSVIIPSKDQPELLFRCLTSLKKELIPGDEILVVDNGSSEENQEKIKTFLEKLGGRYLYRKMDFQFSVMCNLGAEQACNEVLLFLNDDVEIPEEEYPLFELVNQACQPYTGAVGAKLLYPDSRMIQHAGICNQLLGPVHKLQFKEDNIGYYYGWNRGRRNVIAVTGACLAVEKKKFMEAGGFPEELAVAFNDVSLCFSLYEKGYYNVVCQDVELYHHESLSRGKDDDSTKLKRLLREKELLYRRHPEMSGQDPFYHKYFVQSVLTTGFETGAEYERPDGRTGSEAGGYKTNGKVAGVMKRLIELPKGTRQDACLMISIEAVEEVNGANGKHTVGAYESQEQHRIKAGRQYLIQGHAFVAGSDNARYNKYIILGKKDRYYQITPEVCLRRDVEENLPDQMNVGLSGFRAVLSAGKISPGSYTIGVLAVDCCSRGKLINWTGRKIEIVQSERDT